MRKVLLIAGIVILIAAVFCWLAAALNLYGYRNVIDGTASLYSRLHRRMISFFVIGTALAAAGTACLIVRANL